MGTVRRAGFATVAAIAPFGLAYRFALAYRVRAGYPRRYPPSLEPSDLGLPFEATTVESAGLSLPAWFIPARGGAPGPGVVLVHGWESARDRTLPMAVFLHAAGFHCLTFDVRGHGANPAEALPLSAGEFGADALAAFQTLIGRPEVTVGAISGHSMGAIGALLASAADPRVGAVVATSSPADPYRLTRQTFRLAHLPIPDPIAYPLAWLTTRVYLRPRGHEVDQISAATAAARYDGPILLAHGSDDVVVPPAHLDRLAAAARSSRVDGAVERDVETLLVPGGQHSWLYEVPQYRSTVAGFLSRSLGGPLEASAAAAIAAATQADRIPDGEAQFAAVEDTPGGLRTLAQVALPGATRARPDAPEGSGTVAMAALDELARRRMSGPRPEPVWMAISAKRAIRQFADRPLEADHLDRILQAGRHSGSSKNLQRWTFIVCRDREHLLELAGVGPTAGHLAGAAAGIALVTPDPQAPGAPMSILFDLGQAAQNMMLAAWELGIGSVPATVYEHDLARRLLGYPADQHCEYLLSFGYPADSTDLTRPPNRGGRRELGEMVRSERW